MATAPKSPTDRVVFSLYTERGQQERLDAAAEHLGMSKATIVNRLLDAWLDGKLTLSNLAKCPATGTRKS